MATIYEHALRVPREAIDGNGHVNNVAYVGWLQDAAAAHCDALGWTADRFRARGATWIVRSHFIEYLRPAFAGDELVVRTWVDDLRRIRSRRRYEIMRRNDPLALVTAETDWVFIDVASGHPRSIPKAFAEACGVV